MKTGYLLIEHIEETQGQMLSCTWLEGRRNANLRNTFFRDLSRIMPSVTRTPLPRIGSFIIDDSGYLQLVNRPLTLEMQDLENERIPIRILRDFTYSSTNSYAMDLLGMHNSRLRNQPNAKDLDNYMIEHGQFLETLIDEEKGSYDSQGINSRML